ncbi:hypothetical protein [Dyadobacter sp. CY356]|uniref:hypothetical protein n=1 Tax=Dyadobacter sp. CY356 TaxID=2906442 RepID=UPI001F490603|nr:hypothetical protein [Dyadobacter sp. CY356]MCF0054162.1 hypothetical protein [Dyadobacter sp. CY356]
MKQLELNNFGFVELNSDELIELEGGFWWIVIPAAMILMDNWGDIRDGFSDGMNGKSRY